MAEFFYGYAPYLLHILEMFIVFFIIHFESGFSFQIAVDWSGTDGIRLWLHEGGATQQTPH